MGNSGRFKPGQSGNPKGRAIKPAPRVDGWLNAITGMGQITRDKTASTTFEVDAVSPEEAMIIWRGDDLAARIVEAMPGDALREGFEIVLDDDDESADTIHAEVAQGYAAAGIARLAAGIAQAAANRNDAAPVDIESEVEAKIRKLNAVEAIRNAACYVRALGGAAILLGVTDYSTDLCEPLDLAAVRGIEWVTVLEPRELQPAKWYTDAFSPNFGKPETWRLVPISAGGGVTSPTVEIHESRLIIFPGTRVTKRPMLGTATGWGDSIFVRVARALRDFNGSHHAAAVLISDFSQAVYKIKDLAATVATDGQGGLINRMSAIDLGRSVARAILVDVEEDFERKATPMSGLPETLDRLAARLAAAADMPLTLLMGQSPGGLNATGASDVRFYYDRVAQLQSRVIEPAVRRLVDVILATLGQPPGAVDYKVEFGPLWQETDKERADARKVQADIDGVYCGLGVYTPDEVAIARFGGDAYSYETKIDFAARAAQAALAPAPPAAPPLQGPPGAPPGGGGPPRMDGYNPDQDRDEGGRWEGGAGGGPVAARAPKGKPPGGGGGGRAAREAAEFEAQMLRDIEASRAKVTLEPTPTGDARRDKAATLEHKAMRFGRMKIVEEARAAFAGAMIGRGFMETTESFLARSPSVAGIKDWLVSQGAMRADAGDFDETKHPRAADGRFGEVAGSGGNGGDGGKGKTAAAAASPKGNKRSIAIKARNAAVIESKPYAPVPEKDGAGFVDPAEGYIRLYRGGGGGEFSNEADGTHGRWFTTSQSTAESYAGTDDTGAMKPDGVVLAVDVHRDMLPKFAEEGTSGAARSFEYDTETHYSNELEALIANYGELPNGEGLEFYVDEETALAADHHYGNAENTERVKATAGATIESARDAKEAAWKRQGHTPQPLTFQSAGVLKLVEDMDNAIDPIAMKSWSDTKGGMTFHKASHTFRTVGYSVAKYPERERVFDRNATVDDIKQYVADNADVFAADPDAHVGGWLDTDTGKYVFDVSTAFDSLDDAMDLAIKGGQAGIYDLARGVTIEVDRAAAEARWKAAAKTDSVRLRAGDDARANEGRDRRDAWRAVARRGADGAAGEADRVDFDPDQPRAEDGKWTAGGGASGGGAPPPKTGPGSAGASPRKPGGGGKKVTAWKAHKAKVKEAEEAAARERERELEASKPERDRILAEYMAASPERQREMEDANEAKEKAENDARFAAWVAAGRPDRDPSAYPAGSDTFNVGGGPDQYGEIRVGKNYPRENLPGGMTSKEARAAAFKEPVGGYYDPVSGTGLVENGRRPTGDEVRAVDSAWQRAALRSVSIGELDREVADAAGVYFDGHSDNGKKVTDLPPVLYHVTTAADLVRANGIKTRAELGQNKGKGLGSGPDDQISFTPSPELAAAVQESMLEYHDLLNGRASMDAFIFAAERGDGAQRPYIEDALSSALGRRDASVVGLMTYVSGKTVVKVFGNEDPPEGERVNGKIVDPSEWVRDPGNDGVTGKGVKVVAWKHVASDEDRADRVSAVYKSIVSARERAGGKMDPMFIGTDVAGFKAVPREQIQVIKFKSKDGAQGYNGGDAHLAEWRTWSGDAVEIADEGSPRTDYNPDQPRAEDGRFGEVAGSGATPAAPPTTFNEGHIGRGATKFAKWAKSSGMNDGVGNRHAIMRSGGKTALERHVGITGYVNKALASQNPDLPAQKAEDVKALDEMIARHALPEDVKAYRGAHSDRYATAMPGDVIEVRGFLPTTVAFDAARQFAFNGNNQGDDEDIYEPKYDKPTIVEMIIPKGTPAVVGDLLDGELLLGRGHRLEVVSVKEPIGKGDARMMTVRLLTGGPAEKPRPTDAELKAAYEADYFADGAAETWHARRIENVAKAFDTSPAIIVTGSDGRETLLIKSGEHSNPEEGAHRVSAFAKDGPIGHTTRATMAKLHEEVIYDYNPESVRAATDDDVMAWTGTAEFADGAAKVAEIQKQNSQGRGK